LFANLESPREKIPPRVDDQQEHTRLPVEYQQQRLATRKTRKNDVLNDYIAARIVAQELTERIGYQVPRFAVALVQGEEVGFELSGIS